jgi:hypothetical protein
VFIWLLAIGVDYRLGARARRNESRTLAESIVIL